MRRLLVLVALMALLWYASLNFLPGLGRGAGRLTAKGKVGSALSIQQGAEAARQAVLNALAQVAVAAGGLSNVARIVRLGVYVNSAEGFTAQPQVANGASDLLVAVFGDAGRHARTAVGAGELPLDAPVELELIVRTNGVPGAECI